MATQSAAGRSPAELFPNGEPPSDHDLRRYLMLVLGVDRQVADQIAETYTAEPHGVTWTPETLQRWIDQSVAAYEERSGGTGSGQAQAAQQVQEREETDAARATRNAALSEQRSAVVRNQVQSYYDRAQVVMDQGAAYDGAALAQSFAVGMRTDASGRIQYFGPDGAPLSREEGGQPMPVDAQSVWEEISGLTFNMGRLALPGPKRGDPGHRPARGFTGTEPGSRGGDSNGRVYGYATEHSARSGRRGQWGQRLSELPTTKRKFVTPSQVLALLNNMDGDYLTSLQQKLFDAGLYTAIGGEGTMPSWGQADVNTRQAVMKLFESAALSPDEPVDRVLARLTEDHLARMEMAPGGPGSEAGVPAELVNVPDFAPEITSAETLGSAIDDIAQDLFGQFVPEDRKQALIAKLQERETSIQRTEWERSTGDIRRQAGAQYELNLQNVAAEGGGAEIDAFMAAIANQESGGNYGAVNADSGAYGKFQIMPANWGPWATRAGLGPNAQRTPENQELVAKRIMMDYYQQFGNWRDVAVAWYAGPGRVDQLRDSTRPQGRYPSIARYADQIMDRFAQLKGRPTGQAAGGGLFEVGGGELPPIERFDPAAEAEAILKAQDPVGWEAHAFGERATEFYSLLGGVV